MIPKIFLGGALFGAIGCLSRADYNLPIFLFAYIAWNYLRVPYSFLKFSLSGLMKSPPIFPYFLI
jgi:hypothetical protein